MRLRSIIAALGLAIPMILAPLAPAQAHSGGPPTGQPIFCRYDNRVESCFEQNGDDFWVYDAEGDGASAVVRWWTNYGRSGTCSNTHGYGKWHECKYDLWEGNPKGRTWVYWEHWTYDYSDSPVDRNYISGTYGARISSVWIEPV